MISSELRIESDTVPEAWIVHQQYIQKNITRDYCEIVKNYNNLIVNVLEILYL